MKKKLLYVASAILFSVVSGNAQRVWDMGNNTTLWPLDATGFSDTRVVDGLTEVGGSNFGKVVAAPPMPFLDGYTPTNEFQTGGSSSGHAANNPTTRYFSFPVTGPTTVKVWFRANGGGPRNCIVGTGGGAAALGFGSGPDASTPVFFSVDYTGGAGVLYVYGSASINYFKIESTDTTLSTNSAVAESPVEFFAYNGKINVGNVKSATKINVYSLSGALVKSVETSVDTNFPVGSGLYIIKAKSAEGTKTTKVLVK